MAQPGWKFVLAQSWDLANKAEISHATNRQISLTLNRPGSASFNINMTDDVAALITPIRSALKVYRTSGAGNQTLIWSGYVATVDERVSENSMTVNCVGWFERLNKRMLRRKMSYAYPPGIEDGTIIYQLLAEANLTTSPDTGVAVPVVSGSTPNTPTWLVEGSKLPNEGPGGATAYAADSTHGRGGDYPIYSLIGPAIQALSDLENGVDMWVDPATRQFHLYRKKMKDRTKAIFGYNWGPNNLAQFGRQLDSTVVANYVNAQNQKGENRFAPPSPSTSQTTYGIIEESASLGDYPVSTLLTYAGGEVIYRSEPRVIYSLTPFNYNEGGRVPEPFVDYDVGDRVYFKALWPPRVNIEGTGGKGQAVRVFGIQMNIDEEGNEKIGGLQVSPG